jgi:hypothetical protein
MFSPRSELSLGPRRCALVGMRLEDSEQLAHRTLRWAYSDDERIRNSGTRDQASCFRVLSGDSTRTRRYYSHKASAWICCGAFPCRLGRLKRTCDTCVLARDVSRTRIKWFHPVSYSSASGTAPAFT